MTTPAVTTLKDSDVEECCDLTVSKQVRCVPFIDARGQRFGIVAQ